MKKLVFVQTPFLQTFSAVTPEDHKFGFTKHLVLKELVAKPTP